MSDEADSDKEKNYLKGLIDWLKGIAGDDDGKDNPIAFFAHVLAAFLENMLNPEADPDFEVEPEADDHGASASASSARRDAERQRYKGYNDKPGKAINPQVLATAMVDLAAMRQEAKDKGIDLKPISPVESGRATSGYGTRTHPIHHDTRMHNGLDVGSPEPGKSVPIRAPMPGVVVDTYYSKSYGLVVKMIDADGYEHFFAHCESANVKIGQRVQQGQNIAMMGETGAADGVHLHYEVRDPSGKRVNPMSLYEDGQLPKTNEVTLLESAEPGTRNQAPKPAKTPAAAPAATPAATAAAALKVKPLTTESPPKQQKTNFIPEGISKGIGDMQHAVQGVFENGLEAIGLKKMNLAIGGFKVF